VVNASPVILLAKIGQITLLESLCEDLVIPASVVAEIEAGPAHDPARNWLRTEGTKHVKADLLPVPSLAPWDLGAGEMAVLTWAFTNRMFEAIVDDRAARKCARVQGIPVRGTLGVILTAKSRGLIPAAKPLCAQVVQAGLRIEPAILAGALKLVRE
jgi:predicted nucleic acid-binding protein